MHAEAPLLCPSCMGTGKERLARVRGQLGPRLSAFHAGSRASSCPARRVGCSIRLVCCIVDERAAPAAGPPARRPWVARSSLWLASARVLQRHYCCGTIMACAGAEQAPRPDYRQPPGAAPLSLSCTCTGAPLSASERLPCGSCSRECPPCGGDRGRQHAIAACLASPSRFHRSEAVPA
jgi:hypothetical protein